jgi:alginate O-acetyltransferase complex protein AlgI
MLFTSPRFFCFLIGTLILLAVIRQKQTKKHALAFASCFFYAAWDWRYLGLLLVISVIDYYAAYRISSTIFQASKKRWLLFSIVTNLGVLGYFKYCNFFIDNFNTLTSGFGFTIPGIELILPAGISFYTFKTMSYTIDVYRGTLSPCKSWLDYATFITFFPELIAGPIVRGSVFLPQMDRLIGPTTERLVSGSSIFLIGLVKKLLIADRMAVIADPVFANPEIFTTTAVWCAVLAYTIQIYCDFSGYSDMAIGTARMIGYDLPENFAMPYISTDITEFWRRWHMTLSTWLKDYLYIPLGGNRGGELLTYRNLFLTMLLGGLWHGASWNFVLWGGLHGLALAAHKLWRKHLGMRIAIPKAVCWGLTLIFVMLTWVPFRSTSLGDTVILLKSMAGFALGNYNWVPVWLFYSLFVCLVAHFVGWHIEKSINRSLKPDWLGRVLRWFGVSIVAHPVTGPYVVPNSVTILGSYFFLMMLLLIYFFAPLSMNPFIYFQF